MYLITVFCGEGVHLQIEQYILLLDNEGWQGNQKDPSSLLPAPTHDYPVQENEKEAIINFIITTIAIAIAIATSPPASSVVKVAMRIYLYDRYRVNASLRCFPSVLLSFFSLLWLLALLLVSLFDRFMVIKQFVV